MEFIEKTIFVMGGVLGLLVFVSFFEAIHGIAQNVVSSTALVVLGLAPFVMISVIVISLIRTKRRDTNAEV